MEHLYPVFNMIRQVIMLSLVGLIGYLAGRAGYLPSEVGTSLSKLVVKVTSPLLILTTLSSFKFSPQSLHDGLLIYFFAVLFITMGLGLAVINSKTLKLEPSKDYSTRVLLLSKLLIIPIIAIIFFRFICPSLDPFIKPIVVLILAMPCATVIPALAEEYGADHVYATKNVLFSTLIGILTLPIILYLVNV